MVQTMEPPGTRDDLVPPGRKEFSVSDHISPAPESGRKTSPSCRPESAIASLSSLLPGTDLVDLRLHQSFDQPFFDNLVDTFEVMYPVLDRVRGSRHIFKPTIEPDLNWKPQRDCNGGGELRSLGVS